MTTEAVFWLGDTLCRVDYAASGPPWSLQRWDEPTQGWQNIGLYGAVGPAGPTGPMGLTGPTGPMGARATSGLLSQPPRNSGILDGNYLARMDGLAVFTASGDAIATQDVRVVSLEEHILTTDGAVILV